MNEFSRLPGIGKKSALRLVLYLLRQESEEVIRFAEAVKQVRTEVQYCRNCHNISDSALCEICADPRRDHTTVCVVESIRDVMAVENTRHFNGVYHVLGGVISPMEGIGPDDLNIATLEQKLAEGKIRELILALSTTMEGDTTNFYLFKRFSNSLSNITTIARGINVGDELEYADEVTLGRSLVNRLPFEKTL